jgi:hypothetical protein
MEAGSRGFNDALSILLHKKADINILNNVSSLCYCTGCFVCECNDIDAFVVCCERAIVST